MSKRAVRNAGGKWRFVSWSDGGAQTHTVTTPSVDDAFDGFERLYALWLTDAPPDCRALRCLR